MTEFPVGDAGANPQRIAPLALTGSRASATTSESDHLSTPRTGSTGCGTRRRAPEHVYFCTLAVLAAVAFGGVMQTATCGGAGAARRAAELRVERHGLRVLAGVLSSACGDVGVSARDARAERNAERSRASMASRWT